MAIITFLKQVASAIAGFFSSAVSFISQISQDNTVFLAFIVIFLLFFGGLLTITITDASVIPISPFFYKFENAIILALLACGALCLIFISAFVVTFVRKLLIERGIVEEIKRKELEEKTDIGLDVAKAEGLKKIAELEAQARIQKAKGKIADAIAELAPTNPEGAIKEVQQLEDRPARTEFRPALPQPRDDLAIDTRNDPSIGGIIDSRSESNDKGDGSAQKDGSSDVEASQN